MIIPEYILKNYVSNLFLYLHHLKETIYCVYFGTQIFRSIDSSSVKGFPKEPKDASGKVNENSVVFLCFPSIHLTVATLCVTNECQTSLFFTEPSMW